MTPENIPPKWSSVPGKGDRFLRPRGRSASIFLSALLVCASVRGHDEAKPVSALSNEALISRLQEADLKAETSRAWAPSPTFLPLGAPVNIGPTEHPIYIDAPDLTELVRRGARAVPNLLEHLSDARPTAIVFAVAPRGGSWRTIVADADYDYRYASADRQPTGVNTKNNPPLVGDGTYRVKVGDLCFTALGQIVGRKLWVVGWNGGEGGWPQGAGIGAKIAAIHSPVARPALAAAARADWDGLSDSGLEQYLLDRANASAASVRVDLEAVDRLLFYYRASGVRTVKCVLETNSHAWAKEALVKELGPFQGPELNPVIYQAYLNAVAAQTADLQTQPPGTWEPSVPSLGSTLPLDCALLLIHQGHDDDFRAFAEDRMKRIREADAHPAPRPTPVGSISGIDTLRLVHNYELECYEDLLQHLDGGSAPLARHVRSPETMPPATPDLRAVVASVKGAGDRFDPLIVNFRLPGIAESRVKATRMVVTRARDDIGVHLEPREEPSFSYVSVGRTSDAVLTALPPPSFSILLTAPSKPARQLADLEGWVEAVVPDMDPDGIAVVKTVQSTLGKPAASEAFARAGITLTVFDRDASEKYGRKQGLIFAEPPEPTFHGIPVPGTPGGTALEDRDLAVLIRDPEGRLITTEFQTRDGGPIRYNHNGSAHYGALPGTRLDIYHFEAPLPADAQIVCLLVTAKDLVVAPFQVETLALP